MEKLGKKIEEIRKNKGISVKELSEKANLTTVEIRRIERGLSVPQAKTLVKIANALECDCKELYSCL